MNNPLPPSLIDTVPWNEEPGAVWAAASLTLERNLAKHPFPSKMGEEEAKQVTQTLIQALDKEINLKPIPTSDLSAELLQLVYEHFLFLEGQKELPKNSSILVDDKARFIALVNGNNHLQLRAIATKGQWQDPWSFLTKTEEALGKELGFAFSPTFGYLTSDHSHCGTGLVATIHLHLPALIHTNKLTEVLKELEGSDVEWMGLTNDPDHKAGDFLILQNRYTLGVGEEAVLQSLQSAASKLIGAEKGVVGHLKQEATTDLQTKLQEEIKDQVGKAFGLIAHSKKLEIKEALDLLSTLRLGAMLGYIEQIKDEEITPLFFQCRQGALSYLQNQQSNAQKLSIEQERAKFLKEKLKGAKLKE